MKKFLILLILVLVIFPINTFAWWTELDNPEIKKLLDNPDYKIDRSKIVINTSDWVIDLGPEGGDQGGSILFEGLTKDLIKLNNNQTGIFLKKYQESLALSTAS